jgi:hypothetical protein
VNGKPGARFKRLDPRDDACAAEDHILSKTAMKEMISCFVVAGRTLAEAARAVGRSSRDAETAMIYDQEAQAIGKRRLHPEDDAVIAKFLRWSRTQESAQDKGLEHFDGILVCPVEAIRRLKEIDIVIAELG